MASIKRIQQLFTQNRNDLEQIYRDPKLVSAYTLFYYPTNIFKLQFLLENCPDFFHLLKDTEVIDYGAGPGTLSNGLEFLLPGTMKAVTLVEKQKLMREQAKKLREHFFEDTIASYTDRLPGLRGDEVLICGHVINETGADDFIQQIKRKGKPRTIAFFEPGTKESFEQMLIVREFLIAQGYQILFPCPSAHLCPLECSKDWCHQYVNAEFDDEFNMLMIQAKLRRNHMPVVCHLYTLSSLESSFHIQRVVRSHVKGKGAFEFDVCRINENSNEIHKVKIMHRNLRKDEQKKYRYLPLGANLNG